MPALSAIPNSTRALIPPGHLDYILSPCGCGDAGCPMDAPFRHILAILLLRLEDVRRLSAAPGTLSQMFQPVRSASEATEALIVAFFSALVASGGEALVCWPEHLRGLVCGLPELHTPPPLRLLHHAIRMRTPEAPARWLGAMQQLRPAPGWQPACETCSSARIDLLCDALALLGPPRHRARPAARGVHDEL